jgi:glycosyltransferase involved in cell wall biosynthesis
MAYRPKVSVVIGSYNRRPLLELCIEAVRTELAAENFEIIVVDGGSDDGTVEWLTAQKDVISIIQHNRGEWRGKPIERRPWAYFMNLAFKAAAGEYVCMLSDDSLIVPGAIRNGLATFDRRRGKGEKIGGLAFYFRDYPVRKEYAVAANLGNVYVNHGLYLNEALAEVGYADEDYHFYFADTDLVLKMKQAGYKVVPTPTSFVEHYFEATPELRQSNNDFRKQQDRERLLERWQGVGYPYDRREYYERHIGRWREHPDGFTDPHGTIDKLIEASRAAVPPGPSVSVVIVNYNNAKGLEKTLRNVCAQTYPHTEIVVVDGASTDGSAAVIERHTDRIAARVSEPDTGIYDAMNKGMKMATGDFVIYMNTDDTFADENVLSRVAPELAGDGHDVVYGSRIYEVGKDKVRQPPPGIEAVHARMPYCHQAAFCRRTVLLEHPFNTFLKFAADYLQVVEMHKADRRFKKIDAVICRYQAGGASESGIRPYLEVLKIQFDNFPRQLVLAESVYWKGLKTNWPELSGQAVALEEAGA